MTEDSLRDAELLQFCEEMNNTFEIDIEIYYKKFVLMYQQWSSVYLIPIIIDLILIPYIPVVNSLICLAVGVLVPFIGVLYNIRQIRRIIRKRSFRKETDQQDQFVERYSPLFDDLEYVSLTPVIRVMLVQTLVKYIFRRLYFSLFLTLRGFISNYIISGDWLFLHLPKAVKHYDPDSRILKITSRLIAEADASEFDDNTIHEIEGVCQCLCKLFDSRRVLYLNNRSMSKELYIPTQLSFISALKSAAHYSSIPVLRSLTFSKFDEVKAAAKDAKSAIESGKLSNLTLLKVAQHADPSELLHLSNERE